jgi:uncharacterized protein YjeT (DUF2065 family)
MPSLPATSFTDLANGAAGLVVVVSGVFAGVARSLAILRGVSAERIERATATGFLARAAIAMLVLVIEGIGR